MNSLKGPKKAEGEKKRKDMEEVKSNSSPMELYLTENPKQYGRPKPVDGDETIPLGDDPSRTVRVGKNLDEKMKSIILQTLREFQDVFAYTANEMPGIDPSVMAHELNIREGHKPVKQKLEPSRNSRSQEVDGSRLHQRMPVHRMALQCSASEEA